MDLTPTFQDPPIIPDHGYLGVSVTISLGIRSERIISHERENGVPERIRTSTVRPLEPLPLPLGYEDIFTGRPGENRTLQSALYKNAVLPLNDGPILG